MHTESAVHVTASHGLMAGVSVEARQPTGNLSHASSITVEAARGECSGQHACLADTQSLAIGTRLCSWCPQGL